MEPSLAIVSSKTGFLDSEPGRQSDHEKQSPGWRLRESSRIEPPTIHHFQTLLSPASHKRI